MRKKILIAEDEKLNFQYLEVVLRKDYDVLWAHNGKEAVEMALGDEDISLVLMDHKMPIMNGIDALKLIKKSKPEMRVVIQTAFAFDAERDLALNEGADGYITKPIRVATLMETITTNLKN